MALVKNVKLNAVQEFQIDQKAVTDVTLIGETPLPMELEAATPAINSDWTYSATAEGRTGEVAVSCVDLDDLDGIISSGPSGAAVRVKVSGFDVDAATTIAAEQADTMTLGLYVNNVLVDYADEGFVAELDDEVVDEFNLDTYVGGLIEGDVIRLAYVSGTEEVEMDIDLIGGGSLNIS